MYNVYSLYQAYVDFLAILDYKTPMRTGSAAPFAFNGVIILHCYSTQIYCSIVTLLKCNILPCFIVKLLLF